MHAKDKKVFVGLSGGVDSAVSAALLLHGGAHVTGVFIKGWYPLGMPCPWATERRDAMRVAARLGIPFLTFDASQTYKKNVIEYLLSEYQAGRTPNPDVMCNRDVKFGVFANFALEQGADFIATGHYSRIAYGVSDTAVNLFRGRDIQKDQSYFLWAVPPRILSRTLFPIGEIEKKEVRILARTMHLPVAKKKDSQGICFLGDVSVDELLRSEFDIVSGPAFCEDGREVGRHNGAMVYTLGERIALSGAASGPWYVQSKDIKNNTLIVSHEKWIPSVGCGRILLQACNWFSNSSRASEVQYRYHGPLVKGRIVTTDIGSIFEAYEMLPEPPASGQSLVAYYGNECVGGGIIV